MGPAFDQLTLVEFFEWYHQCYSGARGQLAEEEAQEQEYQEGQQQENSDQVSSEDEDDEEEQEQEQHGEAVAAEPVRDFVDTSNKQRVYRKCSEKSRRIIQTRAMPMTDIEDTVVHLLKINYATRSDCAQWLEEQGVGTYFEVAWNVLPQAVLSQTMPFIQQ